MDEAGDEAGPPFRLTAKDLAARRGGRLAFAGASFEIGAGDIFVLRGPNGAGKSTLLRVLAGRMAPAEGSLSIHNAGKTLAETATLVGHADAVKAALSAEENLEFWRALYSGSAAGVAAAALAMEIAGFRRQRASTLSAGQRRRLALCRPMIAQRPLWLLDEPTAGMDAASAKRAVAAIEDHAAGGGAAVIATHEPLDFRRSRTIDMAEAA
ncbi:MAG: heme ABC exporter ATP-binding protein CcmA [Parvularculaceae bacterium]|nr:heme ABC exporter ATP-binding protein CcmA [Parvularculaceae bacterium]